MNWIPLEPLAKELGMSLGTAAHKAGLYQLALQLDNRTVDSRSFMSTDEMLKQYAITNATFVVSQEGATKLEAQRIR